MIKMCDYRIREAVIDDCETILQQTVELAVHHGEEGDAVTVTVDDLRRDGFGENPRFRCLMAEKLNEDGSPGQILGHVLFFPCYSSWNGRMVFMEQFYVIDSERGRGIGSALMKKLAQICLQEGFCRLQWEVMDWNTKGLNFYLKQGSIDTTQWGRRRLMRMTKPVLEKYVADAL